MNAIETKYRRKADDYRKSQDGFVPESGGCVTFYKGQPFGWSLEPDVKTFVPGVVVVPESGPILKAFGGNDNDGATEWKPI